MAPIDAERLRRVIVLYATVAMATISLVVAAVAIGPLALRLREDAVAGLRHELALKAIAGAEVLTRARNLAEQVTSRTVIRERLEAYNRGEITLPELAEFTRDKLGDALNLSPELLGIGRFAASGEAVVDIGRPLDGLPLPPLGRREMTLSLIEAGGEPVLLMAAPIIGRGKVLAGTDLVAVDAGSLKSILDEARALGHSGEAAILDAAAGYRVLLASKGAQAAVPATAAIAARAIESGGSVLDESGGYIYTAEPLRGTPWVLVLRIRSGEATASVDRLLLLVILGAAALIGLGVLGLRKVLAPMTGVFIVQHADMARQIGALEQAKAELAAKTRSLALSNAELQEYAYAASHDLQEPVRTIIGFTQLLKRRYRSQMGPEADEFIDFIVEGAERMRRQINDLLSYARLGRNEAPAEVVDMDSVVAEAIEVLHAVIAETGATIEAAPLPNVKGGHDAMLRLMQNLLSNAIKFTKPGEAPRVEITASVADGWAEFTVRDHGIGIEPEYHDRIFHMFERLHPRGHYDGSGIGLAICRKAVELLGGRIWVESRPGDGAAFHFLLPAAKAAPVAADDHHVRH
ncbi:ATP-binding protein [Magnetospirillum sp. UT-4]|uniref:sensor histidine kinase n=1 Tax=Magnetospirillum sp. UT-4 TaxID=2681467 RepID=UPI0013825DAB|nr:ATP-binding protein [Magnetospirillum sp. UT-4]CAA7624385.1 Signal transduction histidine kinase [Magnetospirillum sp. UT-4]